MRGAQEKRVIYDSLSFSVDGSAEGSISGSERLTDDSAHNSIDGLSSNGRTAAAIAKSKAYTKVYPPILFKLKDGSQKIITFYEDLE